MGLFSWIVTKVKKTTIYRKVTESSAFKAATETYNAVIEFARTNRDGLNKSLTQFMVGFIRMMHAWKLIVVPLLYPDTYRALLATQVAALKRFLPLIGYHTVVSPALTGLSSYSYSYGSYPGVIAGYTVDGVNYSLNIVVWCYTAREAMTARLLDNMVYNSAVAAASARDSSIMAVDRSKQLTRINALMDECKCGGYFFANAMNTSTYAINAFIFFPFSYLPYPFWVFVILFQMINEGAAFMQYQSSAAGRCILHQNKDYEDKLFYFLGSGMSAELLFQFCMYMLTSATPYQFMASFMPLFIRTSLPFRSLAHLSPLADGFALRELVRASITANLIVLGNMTREIEIPQGTKLFNFLYPTQLLTEKIGGFIEAQGSQQIKAAKKEQPKDWVSVADVKLKAWWNGWMLTSARKVLIRDCPETWDDLMKRPSVQVYWVASKGQLKSTVEVNLKRLTTKGAKVGQKLGFSRFADSLFFLNAETRTGIKYFLKKGAVEILRGTNDILQRVEVLDDDGQPVNQIKQAEKSSEIDALHKIRATERSRVNFGLSDVNKSPGQTRATSASSASSVSEISKQLSLVGGSRLKGMPARAESRVNITSAPLKTAATNVLPPAADVDADPKDEEMHFLLEDAIVSPTKKSDPVRVVEMLDQQDESDKEANDNAPKDAKSSELPPLVTDDQAQEETLIAEKQSQQSELTDPPSGQISVLTREWDQRSAISRGLVPSHPVQIPQAPQADKNEDEVLAGKSLGTAPKFSFEDARKKGISRVTFGMGKK